MSSILKSNLLIFVVSNAGSMPLSVSALSPKAQDIFKRLKTFIKEYILPLEPEFYEYHTDPATKWKIHPKLEALKVLNFN